MGSSQPSPPSAATVAGPLAPHASPPDLSAIARFARRRGDALFGYIERCQVDRRPPRSTAAAGGGPGAACFGDFLDAGTGSHSLRWVASILHRDRLLDDLSRDGDNDGESLSPRVSMTSFVAVTADEKMRRRVLDEARGLGVAGRGEVVIGNWKDGVRADEEGGVEFVVPDDSAGGKKALLQGRTFDTILADYLVGAIDGFSPYFQDQVFHRLRHHLRPGGRMYVIGLQPIPDRVDGDGDVFCRITRARDACILLAGHRCYREYPLDWIERQVTLAGLDVVGSRTYPIRYDHKTMVRQIEVGRSKLKLFASEGMAREMGKVLDDLERESLAVTRKKEGGRITLGFDYVLVAERPE